jgi:hypothetical protein
MCPSTYMLIAQETGQQACAEAGGSSRLLSAPCLVALTACDTVLPIMYSSRGGAVQLVATQCCLYRHIHMVIHMQQALSRSRGNRPPILSDQIPYFHPS